MSKIKLSNEFLRKVAYYDVVDTKKYRYFTKCDYFNFRYDIYTELKLTKSIL